MVKLESKVTITTGTCRCTSPRPFQYLSSGLNQKGVLVDYYRCDSCSGRIESKREER